MRACACHVRAGPSREARRGGATPAEADVSADGVIGDTMAWCDEACTTDSAACAAAAAAAISAWEPPCNAAPRPISDGVAVEDFSFCFSRQSTSPCNFFSTGPFTSLRIVARSAFPRFERSERPIAAVAELACPIRESGEKNNGDSRRVSEQKFS